MHRHEMPDRGIASRPFAISIRLIFYIHAKYITKSMRRKYPIQNPK
ncbi:hypothetical protein BGLA2_740035 [Burkholderia gladioli]|nr:hypothetical protein BGLA2_740035 [Burkholderia gladioli]